MNTEGGRAYYFCFIFLLLQSIALLPNILHIKEYPLKKIEYLETDDLPMKGTFSRGFNNMLLQLAAKFP